jgi:hypothetical protein
MKTTTEDWTGRLVLLICHVAGLLDLVILPLWVGGLIQTYQFEPQAAGGLVTLYLVGMVISNVVLAFRFERYPPKLVAGLGFAIPAVAFLIMSRLGDVAPAVRPLAFAILNFVGGLGAGIGMAAVHGTIGRSANPHRLFAFVNFGVGIFGVIFFVVTPGMMARMGVTAVFMNADIVIILAVIAALLAFPVMPARTEKGGQGSASSFSLTGAGTGTLAICFIGIVFLQVGNAATLSFVERIGDFRGFGADAVGMLLAVGGLVPLLAPIAAAVLQKRMTPIWVVVCGMLFHGVLSITLSNSSTFAPYAVAYALLTATVVFTHTFAFGLLAQLEPSGRINALTPTMMMTGSAAGPFLGGTIAQFAGFSKVGIGAAICAALGAICYVVVASQLRRTSPEPA